MFIFFPKERRNVVFSTLCTWADKARREGGGGRGQRGGDGRKKLNDTFQNNTSTYLIFFLSLWFGLQTTHNFNSNFW